MYSHHFSDDLFQRDEENPPHSDICFIVNGEKVLAHKVVLVARCPYFQEMFKTRWKDKAEIAFSHSRLDTTAFKAVIHYLYTERLQVRA